MKRLIPYMVVIAIAVIACLQPTPPPVTPDEDSTFVQDTVPPVDSVSIDTTISDTL